MALTELQALMGSPDRTHFIFDANDRTLWDYNALDGRIELFVAPREGRVKAVEVRPSLALTRRCVRAGRTLAQANAALSTAMSDPGFSGLLPFHGDHPDVDPTHELWATDGTLDIWVDAGTGRIQRVREDRHLVMGQRVP